jgi:phasin
VRCNEAILSRNIKAVSGNLDYTYRFDVALHKRAAIFLVIEPGHTGSRNSSTSGDEPSGAGAAGPTISATKISVRGNIAMNDQFTRQAQDMFAAAKDARIPENIQAIAEDGVAKTREAFDKMQTVSKDGVKTMENVMLTAQAGARTLGEKVLRNVEINTEAAFDAAEAIAKAKTVPELVKLQTSYFQQQMTASANQSKELFELSAKIAQQTFETMNAAAAKTFEQIKKTA